MNRGLDGFPYPVTVQCSLEYSNELSELQQFLEEINMLGFYGIELNLADPNLICPDKLKCMLKKNNLKMTYLATGLFGRYHGFCLGTDQQELRRRSVQGFLQQMKYAEAMECGVVLGYFKGSPELTRLNGKENLAQSLAEILKESPKAAILLEATCHYETAVINALSEALDMLERLGNPPSLYILPDTCNMHIEEREPENALECAAGRFHNIHFSDSNDCFPGLGGIYFKRVLKKLEDIHYHGTVCLEAGQYKSGRIEDLRKSVTYLCSLI